MTDVSYTSRERALLSALAIFGFVALNGAFFYGLLVAPSAMAEALTNPVALAFIIEALILVPVFAYLFAKWQVSRLPPIWFVVLSIVGGLAFSVPIAVLYRRR